MELMRMIKTTLMMGFVVVISGLMIWTRINAYNMAPTMTAIELQGYPLYLIPVVYLWDYISHAWICLGFAFVAAGLLYEFIPKDKVTKHMSSKSAKGYLLAITIAPLFTVCSCTMVPLFAGIFFTGGGIGPAIAFLLMAPSANILTILITGELISWEVALARIVASGITALFAGFVVARTPWGMAIESENQIQVSQTGSIDLEKLPLDKRLENAFRFSIHLMKQILPFFVVGLIVVSYVEAFMPTEIVSLYLTGVVGVFFASVLGGPLYTPTLIEIALARTFLNLGMTQGPLMAWLMGQPYDIPNMVAASRVVKWKTVATYAAIALTFSIISGFTYGILTGSL